MQAQLIDGRAAAEALRTTLADEVYALGGWGITPGLATVLVGDDYASVAYERRVRRLAASVGIRYTCERLASDAELADVLATVGKLNADPRVSGILVLRPLPAQVPEVVVFRALDQAKDIEAVHPANAGRLPLGQPRYVPSTPASCFHLLDGYLERSGHDPRRAYAGRTLVVIGRSNNVGKPAVLLGLERGATVVACDVHTARAGRLEEFTRQAELLIVAAGVPGLITTEHVREGAIVIDVGINPVRDPRDGRIHLVGDVDVPGVAAKAEAVSPVPGGVGPVTDVWLVRNTVAAARAEATGGW